MDIYSPIISGPATSNNSYTGTAFIKTGGLPAEFLMANGSVKTFGLIAGSIAEGNHTHSYEAVLGNPGVSGYVLSSTTAGVRSWVAAGGTDTNWYPTAFAWTGGTTAGPTGSLSGSGMTAVAYAAIPSASGTASGVVNTTTQSFAGAKTFTGNVLAANSITNELDTYTGTSKVTQVITCSLAEYNAIGTKNANTLYVII